MEKLSELKEKNENTIFEYITTRETQYAQEIPIVGSWDWNMKTHIEESVQYKNGQIISGKNKNTPDEKPVKNIILPIISLQYRAEDIDVKDIHLWVDNPDLYHLSFLIKKYHDDVFVIENDVDTFLDDLKEEKIDFGGALSIDTGNGVPEIINMQSIAFCDQTDIMSGPIGIKYAYSISQLRDMEERGWGDKDKGADTTIDELITLSESFKTQDKQGEKKAQTPGRYVEVYMVLGDLPEKYLKEDGNENKFSYQMQIVAAYDTKVGKKGVTLFKTETKNPLKFVSRDKIYGRALGRGGIEELFEDQMWTNQSMATKKDMLISASKTILKHTDPSLTARHPSGLKSLDNLELVELAEGKDISVLDTYPRNISLFDNALSEWEQHAQRMGSATDPLLGESPTAGTPFRLQERVVMEGKGQHEYRRGKYAKHIEEIYKDWIIPYISKQITKDMEFLSELTTEEMQNISDNISIRETNKENINRILAGGDPLGVDEMETFKQKAKEDFYRGGNKKFIKILKDELKGASIRVKVNILNKQKDLGVMADKLTNVFRSIFANPEGFQQVMQIPAAAKAFNEMLEVSGLSAMNFNIGVPQLQAPQEATQAPPQAVPQDTSQSPQ